MTGKIHWRCFHCDATFTKAQVKHAREHFGVDIGDLPVCMMRVPGEHFLLNALRHAEGELRSYRAEDGRIMRAMYAMSADHARALVDKEEQGYNKGVADARSPPDA